MAEKHSPAKPKPISLFSVLFFAILKGIVFAVLAEVLLMLWFSSIILLDSKVTAFIQAQNLLNFDQDFLLKQHPFCVGTVLHPILTMHQLCLHWLFFLKSTFNAWNDWFLFVATVIEIILTRVAIVMVFSPLYGMLMILALVDGVVQRAIRRCRGARESTFKFHRAKHLLGWMISVPYLLFLSWPTPLPISIFLCLHACFVAMVLWYMVMHFKKYI